MSQTRDLKSNCRESAVPASVVPIPPHTSAFLRGRQFATRLIRIVPRRRHRNDMSLPTEHACKLRARREVSGFNKSNYHDLTLRRKLTPFLGWRSPTIPFRLRMRSRLEISCKIRLLCFRSPITLRWRLPACCLALGRRTFPCCLSLRRWSSTLARTAFPRWRSPTRDRLPKSRNDRATNHDLLLMN